jgi:hypothetical protein
MTTAMMEDAAVTATVLKNARPMLESTQAAT